MRIHYSLISNVYVQLEHSYLFFTPGKYFNFTLPYRISITAFVPLAPWEFFITASVSLLSLLLWSPYMTGDENLVKS